MARRPNLAREDLGIGRRQIADAVLADVGRGAPVDRVLPLEQRHHLGLIGEVTTFDGHGQDPVGQKRRRQSIEEWLGVGAT